MTSGQEDPGDTSTTLIFVNEQGDSSDKAPGRHQASIDLVLF